MSLNAVCCVVLRWYKVAPSTDLPGRSTLFLRLTIATISALALAACSSSGDKELALRLPERVLLHYDFSGDWMATAGDQCTERLNLSEAIFLSIGAAQQGQPDRYHIADFFMLEPGEPADALIGIPDGYGKLALAVETVGVVDNRRATIIYALLLEQEGALAVRLRAF